MELVEGIGEDVEGGALELASWRMDKGKLMLFYAVRPPGAPADGGAGATSVLPPEAGSVDQAPTA
jgi:hypothetical protein